MEKTFNVNGMSCGHCVKAVQKELEKLKLKSATVEIGKVKVEYDESEVNEKLIEQAIEDAGYTVA